MLIPSKKHMYTKRWSALGQRKMTTKIILAFSNNIVHQFNLAWFIREDKPEKSWLDIESERLLSVNGGVIISRENLSKIQTVDMKNIFGAESTEVAHISNSRLKNDMGMILLKAGIIEEVSEIEGEKIIREHIRNVESLIKNKDSENKEIANWIIDQGTIGIERIKPKKSLFHSKLHVSSCKIV